MDCIHNYFFSKLLFEHFSYFYGSCGFNVNITKVCSLHVNYCKFWGLWMVYISIDFVLAEFAMANKV